MLALPAAAAAGLATVPVARAGALSDGLPRQLPATFPQGTDWVDFEQTGDTFRAPIGLNIQFDGQTFGNALEARALFRERFVASLPNQARIEISRDEQAREIWNYPVGTRVAHWITYDSDALRTFELRLSEKLANSTWAMGSYSPMSDADNATLGLNHYSGTADFSTRFTRAGTTQEGELTMRRVPLTSCRNCHAGASLSAYQFVRATDAGICGFGPANAGIRQNWAARFEQARGYAPFVVR